MGNWPKTRDEARKIRYRQWAGNERGSAYDEHRCAADVPDSGRSPLFHQCYSPNGKGPDGLYCGRHAKKLYGVTNR
jgi:hypothetical protein